MKGLFSKILLLLLCISTTISFAVISSAAVDIEETFPTIRPEAFLSEEALSSELSRFRNDKTSDSCAFISAYAYLNNHDNWCQTSKDNLQLIATHWNTSGLMEEYSIRATVTPFNLDDGTSGYYIRMMLFDTVYTGRGAAVWCMNDGAYKILVAIDEPASETIEDGQWISMAAATSATSFRMIDRETLVNFATDHGYKEMSSKGKYLICDSMGRTVWADQNGLPYAAWINNNQTAINQSRPDTSVKDENGDPATDENGDPIQETVTDNSTNIDLSNMTITLPDGKMLIADTIIYDESTKTYTIDSHDTYNTTLNYYYQWNYYINYTSITYIGQTEEYNKYYEVYYELPDGRDSADLTKEELEQLNLEIDVIPYERCSDDTSLRSLYHFDGDTDDASYWNYCTDFRWEEGASLTYMDAGVFNGALYLDETQHQFTVFFPSSIGTGDFTVMFRLYQSATLAPQTDSGISMGSSTGFNTIFQMDGSNFKDGSGTTLCSTPVGTWNEICISRSDGTIRYFVNGIYYGSLSDSSVYGNHMIFEFGADQQTYKYLDELRVYNFGITSAYTPTAVPVDTNLALVLPGESIPLADEYWEFTTDDSVTPIVRYDFSEHLSLDGINMYTGTSASDYLYLGKVEESIPYYSSALGKLYLSELQSSYGYQDGVFYLEGPSSVVNFYDGDNYAYYWDGGLYIPLGYYNRPQYKNSGGIASGDYILSVVMEDGTVYSLPFSYAPASGGSKNSTILFSADIPNGKLVVVRTRDMTVSSDFSSYYDYAAVISNDKSTPVSIRYIELIPSSGTPVTAELYTSVVSIDKSQLHTPTLAIKTDMEITSTQIGGIRPSIPQKGMVWALVEGGFIRSLQIYNGQAWEGVDGRIWTGERWIPYSSYNVLTLQDMYDIVDATQNYEYIYSESGFWAWWQKSWNAFTEKLFNVLGFGGTGSSTAPSSVKEAVANALSSLIEGIFGLITEVLKALIGAAADLLSGIFSFFTDTVLGGIKDFFSVFTDGDLFSPFQQSGDDGSTTTGLPEGISTVFAFFSGLFLLMPVELRSILIFGIALMLLLAVFKLVKE